MAIVIPPAWFFPRTVVISLLFAAPILAATSDSAATPAVKNTNVATPLPTSEKAKATKPVALGEASLEYLIGVFATLSRDDTAKQIAVLSNRLQSLRQEKAALIGRLQSKQMELQGLMLAVATHPGPNQDDSRVKAAQRDLDELKQQIAVIEDQIKSILDQIAKVNAAEETHNTERKLRADELAAATDKLLHGAEVKSSDGKVLTPENRKLLLERAQRALTDLRNAGTATGSASRVPLSPDVNSLRTVKP